MGYSSWPVAADVLSVCESYGVAALPEGFDADAEVLAVVALIEDSVGVAPVLAGAGVTSQELFLYGSASRTVGLPRPMVEIESVTLNGMDIVEGEGFLFGQTLPYRSLTLAIDGGFGRLSVRGRVGLFDEIPDHVWTAVRDLVAAKALEATRSTGGSQVREVRQDSVTLKYSNSVVGESELGSRARRIITSLNRVGLGGG